MSAVEKFYGVTQDTGIPNTRTVESIGVLYTKLIAGAQFKIDLTDIFKEQAIEKGANAVTSVTQSSSYAMSSSGRGSGYIVFMGNAVVVEPE